MSGRVVVLRGDAAHLPLPDGSVDAVVCDPPYGLGFMGKEWDSPGKSFVERKADKRNTFDHVGGNHNPVDSADAARTRRVEGKRFGIWCEQWAAECLRVLKPGGYLLAFGGTRTWHRLVCAIEDAGFEVRDAVADLTGYDAPGLMWTYGSGFPKSLDVSKAIDKAGGASPEAQARVLRDARERAGLSRDQVADAVRCTVSSVRDWEEGRRRAVGREIEHLVPSAEYRDRLADLLGYTADERQIVGVGGGSRSLYDSGHRGIAYGDPVTESAAHWSGWGTALKPGWEPIAVARKPLAGTVAQNVLAYGTGALNIDACRTAAGQDYRDKCASVVGLASNCNGDAYGEWTSERADSAHDLGRWPPNVLLSEEAAAEMDRQSGISKSPSGVVTGGRNSGGIVGTVVAGGRRESESGHGDSGGASRFFPVFRYEAKADASERPRLPDGTAWPTVKPVALMRWLVRLVTPPGGTVLDLFCGTGPTGEAAIIEGFDAILLDKDPQALALTRVRLAKPMQPLMPGLDVPDPGERARTPSTPKPPVPDGQDSLFDLPGVA